jgi:hypothetical protein
MTMPGITRRGLAAGMASAAVVAGRGASAQVGEVTRNLPRTYAGARLNLAWGTGQVNVTMADFSREFSDATSINLQFTSLNSDDLQQKTILDTATKTDAFDVYLNAYQWKREIGAYLADLTDMDKHVKGCPPLDIDDFPKAAFDVYSRFGNKLMAIPINGSATCFVWNKKAFRDARARPRWGAEILAGRVRPRQQADGGQALRVQHARRQEHPGRLHVDHRLPRLRWLLHRSQGHAHAQQPCRAARHQVHRRATAED